MVCVKRGVSRRFTPTGLYSLAEEATGTRKRPQPEWPGACASAAVGVAALEN